MTDEEVKVVLSGAQTAGVMDEAESKMIAGVMRIADRTARGLMVPRGDVDLIDVTDTASTIIRRCRPDHRRDGAVAEGGRSHRNH